MNTTTPSTTLVSFLGKSRLDRQTGYRSARYRFGPDSLHDVPFFGMGLLQHERPDRLVLVGTAGSMWDVFFDHQQTDDEATLILSDAVASESVTPELLQIHEERLTHKLGIPVRCLLISYARDDAEQSAILSVLAQTLSPGERVLLDVTHGFRHLPMLALVAARYLALVQGVQVQEVYYGALEMTDTASDETPVLRLGGMLRMLDWLQALAVYEHSGNYGVLAPLLQADGMPAQQAALLAQAAYYERSNNAVQARQALSGAHQHLRAHAGPLGTLFKDTLVQHIDWFRSASRADSELALAERYLQRQDHLRAVSYLYEAYVSRTVERLGGNVHDFDSRKTAMAQAEKNTDVWLLTYLRNSLAHGLPPTDAKNNSTATEARRLLQDQAALERRLQQLRQRLFA